MLNTADIAPSFSKYFVSKIDLIQSQLNCDDELITEASDSLMFAGTPLEMFSPASEKDLNDIQKRDRRKQIKSFGLKIIGFLKWN